MLKPLMNLAKLVFCGAAFAVLAAQAEVKQIKDVLGREVAVDVPVKRAILTFYYPDYIAATGADNFRNVVGISREFWEKFNPGSWAQFTEKMPFLKDIDDVGYVISNTFSTEKALALKPDVLVIPKIQYEALAAELSRFEEAGIPVIVVDFNDQTVENHTQSIRIFGQLAGTEARAEKIARAYTALPIFKSGSKRQICPSRKSISNSAIKGRRNTALPLAKTCGARLPIPSAAIMSAHRISKPGARFLPNNYWSPAPMSS